MIHSSNSLPADAAGQNCQRGPFSSFTEPNLRPRHPPRIQSSDVYLPAATRGNPKVSFHLIGARIGFDKQPTATALNGPTVHEDRMVVEMEGQLGVSLVVSGQEQLSESQS
jgi:hypothetical protein